MPILRLEIYQPQAHYRVPFSYQRRLTYPIPPYSTIIGFIVNACGINDQRNELYSTVKELKISITGKFKTKITEYIWFRNLAKTDHEKTYGSLYNREKNGQIGHIGGQSPMKMDVLEEEELVIYLYHNNKEKIEILKRKLEDPKDRLQPIHIGRAEDWIVYQKIKILEDGDLEYKRQDGQYKHFFWIPERILTFNSDKIDWSEFDGIYYNLTTFSTIENYENYFNHTGKRKYKFIKAKLNDGKIINTRCYFDKEMNIPVFLGDL